MDEPTEGIQPNMVKEIEKAIIRLEPDLKPHHHPWSEQKRTPSPARAAHAFIMMENGRVVAGGPIDGLTDDVVQRHMAV